MESLTKRATTLVLTIPMHVVYSLTLRLQCTRVCCVVCEIMFFFLRMCLSKNSGVKTFIMYYIIMLNHYVKSTFTEQKPQGDYTLLCTTFYSYQKAKSNFHNLCSYSYLISQLHAGIFFVSYINLRNYF